MIWIKALANITAVPHYQI